MRPATGMTDTDPFKLAQAAAAFQSKLGRLPDDVDPERIAQPGAPWSWLASLRDTSARRRVIARLFPQLVAPWPALERLAQRPGRIVLLDRASMIRHWCLLALAGRPGVLRCCIERDARAALQAALGHAFEPLLSVSSRGRSVPERASAWTPAHWACVGYLDWTALLTTEDAALRRMARLSLPPGLLGVHGELREAAADLAPATALALIDELQLEWSC